jgi:UDP-N-acetylmuramate dehydrogenase
MQECQSYVYSFAKRNYVMSDESTIHNLDSDELLVKSSVHLPNIRGDYRFNVQLRDLSFVKTGGLCDVLFYPKDEEDLIDFLRNKPSNLRALCLGNMSNTLVPDGGIRGCVISLSKFMTNISLQEESANVQAGTCLNALIIACVSQGLSCCEKLYCIPGTMGGAIVTNAGVPDFEISDVLVEVNVVDHQGQRFSLKKTALNMEYRNGNVPKHFIITSAVLKTSPCNKDKLGSAINEMLEKRRRTQPVGQPTLGCTFKNPSGYKAWELIMNAGCDGMSIGDARISDIHMNFFVNSGEASSSDFIRLIQLVKDKVFQSSGIMLEEEINVIGEEN